VGGQSTRDADDSFPLFATEESTVFCSILVMRRRRHNFSPAQHFAVDAALLAIFVLASLMWLVVARDQNEGRSSQQQSYVIKR
jgi:hypothetical protein